MIINYANQTQSKRRMRKGSLETTKTVTVVHCNAACLKQVMRVYIVYIHIRNHRKTNLPMVRWWMDGGNLKLDLTTHKHSIDTFQSANYWRPVHFRLACKLANKSIFARWVNFLGISQFAYFRFWSDSISHYTTTDPDRNT